MPESLIVIASIELRPPRSLTMDALMTAAHADYSLLIAVSATTVGGLAIGSLLLWAFCLLYLGKEGGNRDNA